MRAMEYLVSLYPEKTGKELKAIQDQEKLDDAKELKAINAKKLAIIEDINTNGGYFCGRFGSDQRYFYRYYNLRLENSEIMMDVDSIVAFINDSGDTHSVTKIGEMHLEKRTRDYEQYSWFGTEKEQRVTKKEWDEVNQYIDAMTKFWQHIKKV